GSKVRIEPGRSRWPRQRRFRPAERAPRPTSSSEPSSTGPAVWATPIRSTAGCGRRPPSTTAGGTGSGTSPATLTVSRCCGTPADHDGLRQLFSDSVTGSTDDADATIEAYFSELVAQRRRAPRDDLLSALVTARAGDDRLSEAELLATVALIFGAGFVTTTNL